MLTQTEAKSPYLSALNFAEFISLVQLSLKGKLTELYQIVRFSHLPCLQVGQKKDRYLPMEVCTIIPCQKRLLSDNQTAKMIKSTARPAPERRQGIENWVSYLRLTLEVLIF